MNPSTRLCHQVVLGTFVCLSLVAQAAVAESGGRDVGPRHLAEIKAGLPSVGRLPATNELRLAIGLPLRNQAGLTALIQDLYDPGSPNFRQYLSADQFAAQFGPSPQDYDAVIQFAKDNHLVIEKTYGNRVLLDVRGSVANIEHAFGVRLLTFHHPVEGRDFYAPDTEPTVDASLPILAVKGLDNYEVPRPMYKRRRSGNSPVMSGSGPSGTYAGSDFRAAYVPGVTNTGTGQIVGLFQLDGYYANDIRTYETTYGLPNVTITNVLLGGFNGVPVHSDNVVEVSLDIEMVISMAPGIARLMVYEAPFGSPGAYDVLNQMAIDNQAKQISSSWVIERIVTTPVPEQMYQQFAAQGQSFFQASGDQDSYWADTFQVCDDPYVTTVGGTTLTTTGPHGSYVSETVWQWGHGVGSGGGIGGDFTIPSYQLGLNMTTNHGSTTLRNVPDVALTADNVYIRANGGDGSVGGTSCAAPLWAGFMALVNQQAASQTNSTVGFINPAVYALGQSTNYANCFHDVTVGNNTNANNPTLYYACPGYDLCTGWGTPAGANLIKALVSPATPPQFLYETNQGTIIITRYGGRGGAVTIPATINGLPVTGIGDFAFYDWTNLTSVTIPGSVIGIGVGAFADCPTLTSVVTVSNSVLNLNSYAFAGCSNLSAVYFTGNAPAADATVFTDDSNATVYYLPGTTGWSSTFDGRPSVELSFVSSPNDSGAGSLRQMVAVVPAGSRLSFAPNLSGQTILLTNGALQITNNMTIDASMLPNGVQINGNHLSSIFTISGGLNVVLNSLTLTNGYAGGGGSGGAIVNSGTLALNSCTLAGNCASGDGGAIWNGGPLSLHGCTLVNNVANFAGAIQNYSRCFPLNCTFTGNYATNNGGAIDSDFSAVLTLNQCTFFGNTAGNVGGAVDNYLSTLNVANCILAGDSGGGDIYSWSGSTVNVDGTNIVPALYSLGTNGGTGTVLTSAPLLAPLGSYGGPTQTMPPLAGSPAIDAGSAAAASGIPTDQRGFPRVVGASVDIGAVEYESSPVVSNNADNGLGSLRYVINYTTNGATISFAPGLGGSTVLLTGGQIALNHGATIDASALAGGLTLNGNGASRVFEVGGGNTVTINSLTITNGYDTNGTGGGILNNGSLTLNQCVVAGNTATNATGVDGLGGGGIYNQSGSTLALVECTVSNNSAIGSPSRGGGVFNLGTLSVVQSTISANYADFSGGGIFNNSGVTALVLESTVVGNNTQYGGGIDNFAGPLVVVQSTVVGNAGALGGGGIFNFVSPAAITVVNSIVASNSQGGDIDNANTVELVGANIIQSEYGGIFSGPNPINANPLLAPLGNYGGPTQTMPPQPGSPAIDAGSDAAASGITSDQRGLPRIIGPSVDIGGAEFQGSPVAFSADSGPGTLRYAVDYCPSGTLITFATNLSGQTILLTNGGMSVGDYLTVDASSLPNGILINGNSNGPIFTVAVGANLLLDSLTLTNGYAGGGWGGAINNGGTVALNRCTLAGNSAAEYGGAIINMGTLTLTACALMNNQAANLGGAILNHFQGSACTLVNCTLTGNYTAGYGGAIENDSSADLSLIQCTFSGNTAAVYGGAIENDYSGVMNLTQCTFSGNTAGTNGGGAVDNYLATMTVGNSILGGNNGSGDIYNWSGSTTTFLGTNIVMVLDNFGTTGGGGTVLGTEPHLYPLGNYGGPTQTMPPQPGSPAIDAGSDAIASGILADQRGHNRFSGSHVDIGAVEVQIANAPYQVGGLERLGNGSIQFGLTNLVGGSFSVFASTNVALPFPLWTNLGTALETPVGSGQFKFTDPYATNYPQRFYRVRSP